MDYGRQAAMTLDLPPDALGRVEQAFHDALCAALTEASPPSKAAVVAEALRTGWDEMPPTERRPFAEAARAAVRARSQPGRSAHLAMHRRTGTAMTTWEATPPTGRRCFVLAARAARDAALDEMRALEQA